jgi:hypothetical protein
MNERRAATSKPVSSSREPFKIWDRELDEMASLYQRTQEAGPQRANSPLFAARSEKARARRAARTRAGILPNVLYLIGYTAPLDSFRKPLEIPELAVARDAEATATLRERAMFQQIAPLFPADHR